MLDENTPTIGDVLEERGSRYGDFYTHAIISQCMKNAAYMYVDRRKLPDQLAEAIDMIIHKIARVTNINADKTYADTWVDIIGYATLALEALKRDEQQ